MAAEKIQFIDLAVDLEDPKSSAFHILGLVRPEWKKEDVEVKVINNCLQAE